MKLPFKRYVLVHYVRWLEAVGFLFCFVMAAIMAASVFYKIDDAMKYRGAAVTLTHESVELPLKAYIHSVLLKEGDEVAAGAPVFQVVSDPVDVALFESARQLEHTRGQLKALPAEQLGFPSLLGLLDESVAALKPLTEKGRVDEVKAPMGGVLRPESGSTLAELEGQILDGKVASIYSGKALRFKVAVGGNNASMVRINLLSEKDVLDWKILTSHLKNSATDSAPIERIRDLLRGKMPEVKPGKKPLKRLQAEIVTELNGLLQSTDFHDAAVWGDGPLPGEAQVLLDRGPESLSHTELCRMNRLLMEALFPSSIATSANEAQPVKAKIIVTPIADAAAGVQDKPVPTVYTMIGKVAAEPEGGQVLVELPEPPPELVSRLLSAMTDPGEETVVSSGKVVVGRISLFNFLFR